MIDVHAHILVPEAAELAAADPGFAAQRASNAARYREPATAAYMADIMPRWDIMLTDAGARAEWMASVGVESQFIAVNPAQYYYWAGRALAAELVRLMNEHITREAAAHPGALVPIGTVALQFPDLAAEQLRHAVGVLGMAGVQISTTAGARDLSDPAFESLWAAAAELDAVILLHPMGAKELTDRLAPSYLNNIIGQPLETTIALSHLIFTGVFDRHPGLRVCAAHGGGYLPQYLGRGDHAWAARPDSHSMLRRPSEYLAQIWFDSLVLSPTVLRHLVENVGASQVVIGTDYPFDMGEQRPDLVLQSLDWLESDGADAIARGNAVRLLGPHAARFLPYESENA